VADLIDRSGADNSQRRMRTIFLTGGTGFLGSYLARELLEQGNRLVFLARSKGNASASQRVDKLLTFLDQQIKDFKNAYSVVTGDVTKHRFGLVPDEYERLINYSVDEVWHVAGSDSFSEKVRDNTFRANVTGMERVLEFNRHTRPKQFHYVSTAYVCGNTHGVFNEDALDCGQGFHNPYEETKFIAEQKSHAWSVANPGTETFIYRPSIVVGDSRTGKTTRFSGWYTYMRTYHIIGKMFERENAGVPRDANGRVILPLQVAGTHESELNIVTIDYVVDMMMRIRNKDRGGVYHLTDSRPASYGYWLEVGTQIMGFFGITTKNKIPNNNADIMLQQIESQISKGIIDYLPYLTYQPIFDKANVKAILGDEYYEQPTITPQLIEILLNYAVEKDFKVNI
jgi:nucleoside-diphosphate-sugar epimerase